MQQTIERILQKKAKEDDGGCMDCNGNYGGNMYIDFLKKNKGKLAGKTKEQKKQLYNSYKKTKTLLCDEGEILRCNLKKNLATCSGTTKRRKREKNIELQYLKKIDFLNLPIDLIYNDLIDKLNMIENNEEYSFIYDEIEKQRRILNKYKTQYKNFTEKDEKNFLYDKIFKIFI